MNYIITIARGFGSGGLQVGLELSRQLNIPCYYSQILAMASDTSGISKEAFAMADEKLRGHNLLRLLKSSPNTDHILSPTDKKFTSDDNLFNIQAQVIRELAKSESCIIIGKCANWILKDYDNVISVYIEAPRAYCAKSIIHRLGVTENEAHDLIEKTDRYRADYIKYYTGGTIWTDPVQYDMTLNTDRVGREKAAELIKSYIAIKFDGQAE
ncbi:MAG: cytidylate kinase-like family protein [Oscillospiraceae bacterium]|jgi:cytidylate kinase|nr:cytidylate kinase-like family protein [Oscillospiraceae bacterium]